MTDGDAGDGANQTESAWDLVDKRLTELAQRLEHEHHLNFFSAMLLIRKHVYRHLAPEHTKPTVLHRLLGWSPFTTRREQIPLTPSPDQPSIEHGLQEIAETLQSKDGVGRAQSLALVRQVVDAGVRYTASGLVTKCLTPTTAAWAITNSRISPLLASPRFVRAGREVATGVMPSEETLEFLRQLADIMLEESQGA